MAHLVNRKGYWSVEESYRDGKRVRKRYIRYLGRYSIDWRAMFASELGGVDWDAIEKQECARLHAQEKAYQAKLAALPVGLHVGPTDPIAPATSAQTDAPVPSEAQGTSVDASEAPDASEPDAEPSA